jgi:hypothetical protein
MSRNSSAYCFSGHETFVCRYAWLPKAAEAIREDRAILVGAKLKQAMVKLGVGKNMVRSIRFWAEAADIIQAEKGGHILTRFGNDLFVGSKGTPPCDPFLEDVRTLWLIHWKLATNAKALIFGWDLLINQFQEPELYSSTVMRAFQKAATLLRVDVTPGSLEQMYDVFLRSYVPSRGKKGEVREDNLDCPLIELELLRSTGFTESSSGTVEPKYAFRREDKPEIGTALFAYCLDEFWNNRFPLEQSLPFHSAVVAHGSPGQVFKIPEPDVRNRLLEIEELSKGYFVFEESAAIPRIVRNPSKPALTLASAYAMEVAHV